MFNIRKPEGEKVNKEALEKLQKEYDETKRLFSKVFNNDAGEKVIDWLEKYSHVNFPNYENPNATYSKIGEQTLVAKINQLRKAEVNKK